MITDTWAANEAQKHSVSGSLQHPHPGSTEALMVAIWGPDGVPTFGAQMYRRCADGKVEFEELIWEEPSSEFRFARGNMEQKDNVLGLYRSLNCCTFSIHYLSSAEDVLKVEDWLLNELSAGRVHADGAYLTRWIPGTKVVEFVIGRFYEPPPCDEDLFESNQETGSVDLLSDVID
jgi:hypothetical protein